MSLARPDLMDALRRSVEGEKPGRAAAPSKAIDRKKPAKEPERRAAAWKAG